jgi:hypothetical protein
VRVEPVALPDLLRFLLEIKGVALSGGRHQQVEGPLGIRILGIELRPFLLEGIEIPEELPAAREALQRQLGQRRELGDAVVRLAWGRRR